MVTLNFGKRNIFGDYTKLKTPRRERQSPPVNEMLVYMTAKMLSYEKTRLFGDSAALTKRLLWRCSTKVGKDL